MPVNVNHSRIFNLLPVPSLILVADAPKFTIADANQAYLTMALTTREEILGKGFIETFPNNLHRDFAKEAENLQQVITEKKTCEIPPHKYTFQTVADQNAVVKYLKAMNIPVLNGDNEVEYILHSLEDVTEAMSSIENVRLAKSSLTEASQIMDQVQEMANFGNWQWDVINNKVSWSDTLYKIYGLDKDSFNATFEGYQELLHPDDRVNVYNYITGALQSKGDVTFEERIIRPNGEMRYLKSWGKAKTDQHGNVVKMIGACLDITESKLAELQLGEMHTKAEEHLKTLAISEKNYSELFHLSPLPMWVLDVNTLEFLNVNDAAVAHYGYTHKEFLSMTVKKLWPPEKVDEFQQRVSSTAESYGLSSTHLKKDGSVIQVFIQSRLINFNGTKARLVVVYDISERQMHIQAIEKQNTQLQKIAWIQSHLVRAPLTRIMGLVELFEHFDSSEADKRQILSNIATSAKELDEIIKSISTQTDDILVNNNFLP